MHGTEVDPRFELAAEDSGGFAEGLVGRLSVRAPASARHRQEGELEGTPISLEELQRIGAEHDMVLRDPASE